VEPAQDASAGSLRGDSVEPAQDASAGSAQDKEDTFHNQYQSYRTRKHPTLAAESEWHNYPSPGTYKLLVKIVDIFGNDTTKLLEVKV